jgi:ATPase subunit of ABC transporter with duplicated ATPase domains
MKTKSAKPIASFTNVNKSFGNFAVLKGADFSINTGDKIGLVGPNGSGKSTLLKILAGEMIADSGTVVVHKGVSVGYIPQQFSDDTELSAADFLAHGDSVFDKTVTLSFLGELNLNPAILERTMDQLSGGEKLKLALIRIFLAKQDLLLLDEPTNNLDIAALEVLENFILKSPKTFIVISHDREFLDRVMSGIFEIDETDRKLRVYDGNFSAYMEARKNRIEKEWAKYKDEVEDKKHVADLIDSKLARAEEIANSEARDSDTMLHKFKRERGQKAFQRGAKLMKAKLEKMDEPQKPKEYLPLDIKFEIEKRSGDIVFECAEIIKKLPDHVLGPVNLRIQFGDRLLITGANGEGKTTLIKILLGKNLPDSGDVKVGVGVKVGYLPQEEDLRPEGTVREEFLKHVEVEEGIGRRLLNRFKLSADDVEKKVQDLSSGERSRLILAIIMSQKVNCLVLDEPSNHLDLEALESLENALRDFVGTLVVVTHDRYFIRRLGELKILELKNGNLSAPAKSHRV